MIYLLITLGIIAYFGIYFLLLYLYNRYDWENNVDFDNMLGTLMIVWPLPVVCLIFGHILKWPIIGFISLINKVEYLAKENKNLKRKANHRMFK